MDYTTNIKFLLEEMEADAEEYGQYHDDECPLMREDGADFGDECECETIKTLKGFAREWMMKVNEKWVFMAKEHMPYCRPQGREMLVKAYGGRLKSAEHKKKIGLGVKNSAPPFVGRGNKINERWEIKH